MKEVSVDYVSLKKQDIEKFREKHLLLIKDICNDKDFMGVLKKVFASNKEYSRIVFAGIFTRIAFDGACEAFKIDRIEELLIIGNFLTSYNSDIIQIPKDVRGLNMICSGLENIFKKVIGEINSLKKERIEELNKDTH